MEHHNSVVAPSSLLQKAQFSDRIPIRSIMTRFNAGSTFSAQTIRVGGWVVKTGVQQTGSTLLLLELNDGSCPVNLGVTVHATVADLDPLMVTGTCVLFDGVASIVKQKLEFRVEKLVHVGTVDPDTYPIQKKTELSLELMRDVLHLRPRINIISSVARIRNALAFATHTFFQDRGFLHIHTPIITNNNSEGAGEMFQVTTLINKSDKEFTRDGKLDFSKDFFKRQAYLIGSGQLQAEAYACALSSVYTFGPTFRPESSSSLIHLAEFWMVEPELAFADLQDNMNCAEAYVKYMCRWLLEKCFDDMKFMSNTVDKECVDRLRQVVSTPFNRITYTEAIKLLEAAVMDGKRFVNKVDWEVGLASEHERYLTDVLFEKPIIVYNYPKGIKEFHMRLNDDKKTVAAMDVLVPNVGELIGGGQREERYDNIRERMVEMELPLEPFEWYLDLRRYGTVKHSGFGLGFERMILFATGIGNIRDVIPFPRYPGRADP